jgi:hypothetical protein
MIPNPFNQVSPYPTREEESVRLFGVEESLLLLLLGRSCFLVVEAESRSR